MTVEYIVLGFFALLSMGMSFFFYKTDPWISDALSNIGTGFVGSIVLYYLIERVQDKMQKKREIPLKKSILFKIAKHFEVILAIYAGVDLRDFFFIETDADKQFRKEVFGLKETSNIIGFVTLPIEFLDKFFDLVTIIDTPGRLISDMPDYLAYPHKLGIAKDIKELLEMILKLEIDLGYISLHNTIKKAEDTITRLEHYAENSGKRDRA